MTRVNINELKHKRGEHQDRAEAIHELAVKENRDLTDAETTEFDAAVASVRSLTDRIERETALFHERAHAARPQGGYSNGASIVPGTPKAAEYRTLFARDRALEPSPFEDAEDFFRAVASKRYDPRLENRGLKSSVPSDGGFAVPEPIAADMFDGALGEEIVRPRATVFGMESSSLRINGFDGADHTSSYAGGFVASWTAEGATIAETAPKLRQIMLQDNKLGGLTRSSNEVMDDGIGLSAQLRGVLSRGVGWYLDQAFIRGDGAGKPLGVLSSGSRIAVSKESGQGADTIQYENLVKMFARCYAPFRRRAVWLCNDTAIDQLLQVFANDGTTGSHVPVLTESNGEFSMLGRPVIFTEHMNAIGDEGDIALVDMSQYAIGLRKFIQLDVSADVGFKEDELFWRVIVRADGQSLWDSAITPYKGVTQSWCVTLAYRA